MCVLNPTPTLDRVATLWRLEWNNERLLCAVYRGDGGLQLCVESPTGIIASERFAAFSPDTLVEARNRGYRPHRRARA